MAQTGGSPNHTWTDSPGGDYANNLNISLTSEILDLSGADDPELSFMHLCDTESGYEYGYVEVSADGGTSWQPLYQCDNQSTWQNQIIDLLAYAGQPDVRVRFRLQTDGSVTRPGWSIDDVRVTGWGTVCHGGITDLIFQHGFE